MNKYKTLFSNTLLISLGTFGSKILVFFMVRFYTGYLTPADYSTSDLITQTANLLFPLISLDITSAVFRFALDGEEKRKSVFSVGAITIILGALLFIPIVPLLNIVDDFKGYIWLIAVYTMTYCLHSLCAQYIRGEGKTALFAVQGIINTSLVIGLNILFLAVFDMGIIGYVLSVVLADFLCSLFLIFKEKLWRLITLHPDKDLFRKMLKYSIPLIPTTVFWWITSVSDRYMINGMIDSTTNGIYGISYKIPTILTLVSTVFMQAWQFSAVTESQGDQKEHIEFFSGVWRSFQAIMFLAGAVVIAFSKPLIKILSTEEYYSAWQYVPLLAAAMIFSSFASYTSSVYVVTKQSIISFATSAVGAVSNIALNLLLIPTALGAQGAAIATFVSYFSVFIIRAINSRKYIPFKLYPLHITANTAIIALQTVFAVFELPLWILVEVICLVLLAAINFKFLISSLKSILSSIKK